mgnify:CR=1 FL=1
MIALHLNLLIKFDDELAASKNTVELMTPYKDNKLVYDRIDRLKKSINSECGKCIFVAETFELVHDYRCLLRNPIKAINQPCEITELKTKIEQRYLDIANRTISKMRWYDIDTRGVGKIKHDSECPTCGNTDKTMFETDEVGRRTCVGCSSMISTLETGNGHLDFNRATLTGKFIYNRVLHFQDSIKQYQGKQNCKVPQSVYTHLENQFMAYRLLNDSDDRRIKYSKITKQHIVMFLKDYPKQYENTNVIFANLTGKSGEDISHLETKLVEDFKELVTLYDSLHSKDKSEELDRKNFLNVQYILFQLLCRHGHPCKPEDFSMLKTTERKLFHDQVCSNLFSKLGWNFTKTF